MRDEFEELKSENPWAKRIDLMATAEQSIIGALLQDPSKFDLLPPSLRAEDFTPKHKNIADVMFSMNRAGNDIDVITVAEKLQAVHAEDRFEYLSDLAVEVVGTNVGSYAKTLLSLSTDRELESIGAYVHELAYSNEMTTEEKISSVSKRLDGLEPLSDVEFTDFNDLLANQVVEIDRKFKAGGLSEGLKTGFADYDEAINGMEAGDFVILAARPSMGKTALALNIASNVVANGGQVVFYSLEMEEDQLAQRMISASSGVNLKKIRNGSLEGGEWSQLEVGISKLKDNNLKIIDKSGMSIDHICALTRKINRKKKIDLVVIDYLQLITAKAENRTQVISEISRRLKGLAKDNKTVVLALSQLNRGVESRSDARPRLSDLRESGQIEQDADIITFLYRDEVYNEDSPQAGIAELISSKVRNGEIGTTHLASQLQFCRFQNLASDYRPPKPVEKVNSLAARYSR